MLGLLKGKKNHICREDKECLKLKRVEKIKTIIKFYSLLKSAWSSKIPVWVLFNFFHQIEILRYELWCWKKVLKHYFVLTNRHLLLEQGQAKLLSFFPNCFSWTWIYCSTTLTAKSVVYNFLRSCKYRNYILNQNLIYSRVFELFI